MRGLEHLLRTRWTHDEIKSVLDSENLDARKVACLAVALVGSKCCIPFMVEQLKHDDPVLNQMAEHALWSIWLRCGNEAANKNLCRGTRSLNQRDLEWAIKYFTEATKADPTFAEAYNECDCQLFSRAIRRIHH